MTTKPESPELAPGFDGCGIFEGIPFEEYEQWAGLNKSNLWILKRNPPAKYRYAVERGLTQRKPCLDWGQAVHFAVLEPERFEEKVACCPATYTNAKGEEKPWSGNATVCRKWKAKHEAEGHVILDREEIEAAQEAARNVLKTCPQIAGWKHEIAIQWHDAETGVLCRGRIDFWSEEDNLFGDLKTCISAHVESLTRSAKRLGYWEQLLFYRDGLTTLVGGEPPQPYILAVESDAPYLAAERPWDMVYGEDEARLSYRHFLKTVKRCRETGKWPGYQTEHIRPDPWTWGEDNYDDGTSEVPDAAIGGGEDAGELPGALGF